MGNVCLVLDFKKVTIVNTCNYCQMEVQTKFENNNPKEDFTMAFASKTFAGYHPVDGDPLIRGC